MNLRKVHECTNSWSSISVTSARSARKKYVLQASDPFVSVFVHMLCTFCTLDISCVHRHDCHDRHDIPVTLPCLGVPNIPGD